MSHIRDRAWPGGLRMQAEIRGSLRRALLFCLIETAIFYAEDGPLFFAQLRIDHQTRLQQCLVGWVAGIVPGLGYWIENHICDLYGWPRFGPFFWLAQNNAFKIMSSKRLIGCRTF